MDPSHARRELLRGLQLAYSGELGATHAYIGHRHALPPGPDREAIWRILVDEVRHRKTVLAMLRRFGWGPDARAERKLTGVGKTISVICHVGGWFLPMYGAARLEADNIVEYEILARLAWHAEAPDLVDPLLELAEVEWDHELVLRTLASRHPLWRWVPRWPVPAPRHTIRERFAAFRARPVPVQRRRSLLVR